MSIGRLKTAFASLALATLSTLAFNNCGRPSKLPDAGGFAASTEALSYSAINGKIIQSKCVGCHASFGTYAGLMASGTIVALKPDQSSFYQKVASGQMPKGGT